MGTSSPSYYENVILQAQGRIKGFQTSMKSPNCSKNSKESLRKAIADQRRIIARAREDLKKAKAAAKAK